MPWSSGDSLSPSILNIRAGEAALVTGFSTNTLQGQSGVTVNVISDLSTQKTLAAQRAELGGVPSNTSGVLSLRAHSQQTDYIHLQDSAALKSNFLLGLKTGDSNASLVDGLNLYDESANTMIVRFSSDSVRFYPPIVAPIFDTGGALASTYNASLFLRGSSKESQIQAAINAAAADGIRRVYVPASMFSYNAAVISFDSRVQMVREGGNWSVWDVWAYGAAGIGTGNDSSAFSAAIAGVPESANVQTGGIVYVPGGRYPINISATRPGITLQGEGAGMNPATLGNNATVLQSTTGTVLDIGSASQTAHVGWTIRDLHIRDSSGTGGATYGIRIRRMRHVNFDRVSFSEFSGATSAAVYLDGTGNFIEYPEFRSCRFRDVRVGIDSVNATAVRIFGGHWENSLGSPTSSVGVSLGTGSDTLEMFGSAFENFATGVDINGATAGTGASVVGCRFEEIPQNNTTTAIRSRTSNNLVTGCVFTGMAAGVSIDSGAKNVVIIGVAPVNVTSVISDGAPQTSATKIFSNTELTYKSFTASIAGAAGFFDDIRNEGGSFKHVPSLLVSLNRGIQIKDSSSVTGGLFISSEGIADGTNHICEIAGGAYGDVATDLRSALSSACGIEFVNHQLRFWANTGLTAGNSFTRKIWQNVDSTGISKALFADGTALLPTIAYSSESSLGWYRSGTSTLALSYGTLNLNQSRFVSVRTAASLDSTSLATNEMAFQIVAGSVATLAIRSGGTIYYFASSASTKA